MFMAYFGKSNNKWPLAVNHPNSDSNERISFFRTNQDKLRMLPSK